MEVHPAPPLPHMCTASLQAGRTGQQDVYVLSAASCDYPVTFAAASPVILAVRPWRRVCVQGLSGLRSSLTDVGVTMAIFVVMVGCDTQELPTCTFLCGGNAQCCSCCQASNAYQSSLLAIFDHQTHTLAVQWCHSSLTPPCNQTWNAVPVLSAGRLTVFSKKRC